MSKLIGFFMQTPFHYYVYESIVNQLRTEDVSVHLILNDKLEGNLEWGNMYKSLLKFVETLDRDDIDAYFLSTLLEHNIEYDCLISLYKNEYLTLLGKKNVRIMYSLAKEGWVYSNWNSVYDKILCYGKYDYERLLDYSDCEIIGNPKFDKWFGEELPSKIDIVTIYNVKLKDNKKTILYAPTYGDLSSIDEWLDIFNDLQEHYNIIIKLHHGTANLLSEETRRSKIGKHFDNVFDDTHDLTYLLNISDVVITENSGVIYDAAISLTPLLLLNSPKNNEIKKIVLENELILVSNELELRENLLNINNESMIKSLACIRSKYFDYFDGNAGVRATHSILELIKE